MHQKYHLRYPVKTEFGNLPKCITNQSEIPSCVIIVIFVNLRLNCLPGVLSWDLGLSNIFGCCLVNSCGGLRKGEPVQSWVHLGKSTMPGCEKGCQIGSSEQQVHLQSLCCIWSSGYTFGCVFLCPVCTHS